MNSRPKITDNIINEIRTTIKNNPDWNRSRLSKELCVLWNWINEAGKICDISCRDMLRDLDAAGRIDLPQPIKVGRRKGGIEKVAHIEHDTSPITGPLSDLKPLRIEAITSKNDIAAFKSYINQYHYLKYDRNIGENIKYAVCSRDGTPLASLMFGASAWTCRPRDEFIGWDREQRLTELRYTTNNQRFLIYPWVRVDHLASHILGSICRRIARDWMDRYCHSIYLIETYVECDRFRGVSYQASNWIKVGQTTGRGRNSTSMRATLPIKDVYVYPLVNDFRELLCGKEKT